MPRRNYIEAEHKGPTRPSRFSAGMLIEYDPTVHNVKRDRFLQRDNIQNVKLVGGIWLYKLANGVTVYQSQILREVADQ